MPSAEPDELVKLFDQVESAQTMKTKAEHLTKAKFHILNQMSNDEIFNFFVRNPKNFENFFQLDVWTKSLEENNGIVEFLEPYDIIEKILSIFKSLDEMIDSFCQELIFLFEQDKDEKVKHIAMKILIQLVANLGSILNR
jgi:hypothetical protein